MPKDAEISAMSKKKMMIAKEDARKLNVVLLTVSNSFFAIPSALFLICSIFCQLRLCYHIVGYTYMTLALFVCVGQ